MSKSDYNFFSTKKDTSDDVLETVCPKLSYEQRLWGFVICAGTGWFMSFCAFISFFQGNITTFAVVFTIGNLVAVMSTCFLSGPKDQAKKMMKPERYICTAIFFGTMIFTLVCAFAIQIGVLTLISAIVQFCAYVWYALSFIPFGQKMLKSCFASCCDL